eukprot:781421-Pelagomonas_calceolata.AAC.2
MGNTEGKVVLPPLALGGCRASAHKFRAKHMNRLCNMSASCIKMAIHNRGQSFRCLIYHASIMVPRAYCDADIRHPWDIPCSTYGLLSQLCTLRSMSTQLCCISMLRCNCTHE